MRSLKIYFLVLIGLSCVCGMCSKDDDSSSIDDGSTDGYVEPTLSADATWITMISGSLPSFYGPANSRPLLRKWISSKVTTLTAGKNLTGANTGKNYLSLAFEDTDKFTRFCTDKLNAGGKESVSISLFVFNTTPGVYTIDVDQKNGLCFYDVTKADGSKLDQTRTQGLDNSTFTVTKMTLVSTSDDGKFSIYKMSGTAELQVMYFKPGTSSSTDVQNLGITFNNLSVTVTN